MSDSILDIDLTHFNNSVSPAAAVPRPAPKSPASPAPVDAGDFTVSPVPDDEDAVVLAVSRRAVESARAYSLRGGATAEATARRLLARLGVPGDVDVSVARLTSGDVLDIQTVALTVNRAAALAACIENLVYIHEVLNAVVCSVRPDFVSRGDAEAGRLDFRALANAVIAQSMAFGALTAREKQLTARTRAAEAEATEARRETARVRADLSALQERVARESKLREEAAQLARPASRPAPRASGAVRVREVLRDTDPAHPDYSPARAGLTPPSAVSAPGGALASVVATGPAPARPSRTPKKAAPPPVSTPVIVMDDEDDLTNPTVIAAPITPPRPTPRPVAPARSAQKTQPPAAPPVIIMMDDEDEDEDDMPPPAPRPARSAPRTTPAPRG